MAKFYYNGVLLPEIPVIEGYPYTFITKSGTRYNLVFCTTKYFYASASGSLPNRLDTNGNAIVYNYWLTFEDYENGADWSLRNTTGYYWDNPDSNLLWSNYNIPKGSAVATAIYFYSTHPVPEADECYYNDVLLPTIPADVLAEYPYCLMYYSSSNGNMQLLFGKGNWYVAPSTDSKYTYQVWCSVNSDIQWYYCNVNSGTKWSFYKTTYGWWGDLNTVWSNHDIPNGSATATAIYFYGNSPVPAEPVVPSDRTSGYLIQSGGSMFTVTDGVLTAVEGSVNANLFRTYGVDNIPSSDLLVTLTDPVVLYWTEADEIRPLVAVVKGVPFTPQTIESEDHDMTDETILGIETVIADASDDCLFAVSFDQGQTWKLHTGEAWATLSETDTGMSALVMSAISTEDWNSVATTGRFRFRITLPSVDSFLNSLVVDYLN